MNPAGGGRAGRTVAVSGAGGLVGAALRRSLEQTGTRCLRLVRRAALGDDEIAYDAGRGTLEREKLEGADALVHLAGEGIAAGRWTADRKRRIVSSRVDGTRLLAEGLAAMDSPPEVMISASAVGYYGGRGSEPLAEDAAPGEGFLADVCTAWEAAASPAEAVGVRVVKLRIGVVLARDGGALARMLPLFRLGLGGRMGAGRQYMSWVSLTDLVEVIRYALDTRTLAGPVNAVAPGAVSNADFSRVLARVLRRPAIFPAPAFALRLAMGEMARALLLEGCHAVPAALERAGFRFAHRELEAALRAELGL